jgi:hypothetical protein
MATFLSLKNNLNAPRLLAGDILINTSTFQPAHCGIVVNGGTVVHATNKGIRDDPYSYWGTQSDIFRPAPALTEAQQKKVVKIAFEIKGSAEYGLSRAAFKSTFSSGSMGEGAATRLEKYRQRLQNHQGVIKNVYCSELVILCYQLAWITGTAINTADPHFIPLDGCHTWPSTLRRFLKNNATNWTSLGTLDP